MPYRIPTFNIVCNISQPNVPHVPGVPMSPYRIRDLECQLSVGRKSRSFSTGGTSSAGVPVQTSQLAVPMLTDIRGPQDAISFDMVEVPAGSERWYQVYWVEDVGKGFDNEHRVAGLLALAGSWTAPYL